MFVQRLVFTQDSTLQMFIACQGLRHLVGLVADNVAEAPGLTQVRARF